LILVTSGSRHVSVIHSAGPIGVHSSVQMVL